MVIHLFSSYTSSTNYVSMATDSYEPHKERNQFSYRTLIDRVEENNISAIIQLPYEDFVRESDEKISRSAHKRNKKQIILMTHTARNNVDDTVTKVVTITLSSHNLPLHMA